MNTLIKISWRNIWRNPKRTLVMMCAIMIGMWAAVFIAAIMFGLLDQRFKTSISQHISHIQIHNPEFIKERNVKYGIFDWEELKESLIADSRINTFSGRTVANGMLATATLTKGINIIGVDAEAEMLTTQLNENVIEGSYFGDELRNAVLIGKTLADKTKLQERSRVVLTFQNSQGELVSASFRVAGVFRTAHSVYDELNVYVTQSDLNGYVGEGTIINEVAIIANEIGDVNAMKESIESQFPDLTVRTWAEISPELSFLQEFGQRMLIIILVIILFALAFGLVNTMLMSVFERVHELGMLMAVGMNRRRIFGMIMYETAFLTILGAAGGIVLGIVTTGLLGKTGLNLGAVGGDTLNDFGYPSIIYPNIEPSFFTSMVVLVILTAFLTSIYPALKALRLKPAEAVRKEL